MRQSLLAATAFAAFGLAAAPLMADDHATGRRYPGCGQSGARPVARALLCRAAQKGDDAGRAGPNPALAPSTTLTRIAFGSCNHQSAGPQHMWAQIAAQNPQLFLMIGDNVYGDNGWDADAGLESLRKSYALQASHPEFGGLSRKVPDGWRPGTGP